MDEDTRVLARCREREGTERTLRAGDREDTAAISYDQARAYFVNENGKIFDQVLVGVEQTWSDVYVGYYSKVEDGRYSIPTQPRFAGCSARRS